MSLMYTLRMRLVHVVNHAIEERRLFLDSQDYARFIHDLYEFNDTAFAQNTARNNMSDIRGRSSRKRLVDIHGWCLMNDHYHLLLSERVEGGLSLFLRKLNVGYAKYYNERYQRRGFVYQGRTKKVPIEKQAHFLYVLHYIHLNPLDYLAGAEEWRVRSKGSIRGAGEALAFLGAYRWSSYLDYTGRENFPSLIRTSLFEERRGSYKDDLADYLRSAESLPSSYDLE